MRNYESWSYETNSHNALCSIYNQFKDFVNKYIVPSINKRLITSFKNELGKAQILTIG
jgi:hypothetical protein